MREGKIAIACVLAKVVRVCDNAQCIPWHYMNVSVTTYQSRQGLSGWLWWDGDTRGRNVHGRRRGREARVGTNGACKAHA